mgnify:FL=1
MSDAYNAPELNNHYCSKLCPLGKKTVQPAELLQLDRLTIKIIAALGEAEYIPETIIKIVQDGIITEEEKPEISKILASLQKISEAAMETKLWIEKNMR